MGCRKLAYLFLSSQFTAARALLQAYYSEKPVLWQAIVMRFGSRNNNLGFGFEEIKSLILLVSSLLRILLDGTHQVLFLSSQHCKNGKLTGTQRPLALGIILVEIPFTVECCRNCFLQEESKVRAAK
jgi:hypothetical protein